MDIKLTDEEIRVLGCLMEKEMSTPEYYPLSLNSLTNACNQKSNRDPVVSYDEETVELALSSLRKKKLAMESSGSRVVKYAHTFSQEFNTSQGEEAIVCVLLVRGPQTLGEIRGRTERLYSFSELGEVRETISSLEQTGLVKKLTRQPGHKESRYTHLLGDDLPAEADGTVSSNKSIMPIESKGSSFVVEMKTEIDELRKEVQELRQEIENLKAELY